MKHKQTERMDNNKAKDTLLAVVVEQCSHACKRSSDEPNTHTPYVPMFTTNAGVFALCGGSDPPYESLFGSKRRRFLGGLIDGHHGDGINNTVR